MLKNKAIKKTNKLPEQQMRQIQHHTKISKLKIPSSPISQKTRNLSTETNLSDFSDYRVLCLANLENDSENSAKYDKFATDLSSLVKEFQQKTPSNTLKKEEQKNHQISSEIKKVSLNTQTQNENEVDYLFANKGQQEKTNMHKWSLNTSPGKNQFDEFFETCREDKTLLYLDDFLKIFDDSKVVNTVSSKEEAVFKELPDISISSEESVDFSQFTPNEKKANLAPIQQPRKLTAKKPKPNIKTIDTRRK